MHVMNPLVEVYRQIFNDVHAHITAYAFTDCLWSFTSTGS